MTLANFSLSDASKILVSLSVVVGSAAHAQLNIPNPLIKPDLKRPVLAVNAGAPQARPGQEPPLPQVATNGPPGWARPTELTTGPNVDGNNGNNGSGLPGARARFAGFFVSATVGKQAVLRRVTSADATLAQGGGPASNMHGYMPQPLPIASPASSSAAVREESLYLSDGEPIDYIGDSITLIPKVSGRRVTIYATTDGSTPRKTSGLAQVVFVGEVESQSPPASKAVVLQQRDPSFTQSIAVNAKLNINGSANGSTAMPQGGGNPPPSSNGQSY